VSVILLWALFGLLGGAFAHRLADRTLEESASGGWGWLPRCPRCGRAQGPLARLAVLAIPLRRRCAGCGYAPGRAQLAAELVGAALVAALAWRVGGVQGAIWALGTLVLVTVTLTDLRERLIPNAVTYPAIVLALALAFLPGAVGPVSAFEGAVAGGGIGLLMLAVGLLLYRRADVFGLGDVKLAVFIGAASGLDRAPLAIVAGILAGGVLGLAVVALRRSARGTMPYGPALAIGAYLIWLLA
jgi:leader peptidase (prepilin peptidase)/N-methyltransferase